MLSKLKLYGDLADFCGGQNQFEAVINQPIDAVRFLKANFAGLEQHMSSQFYKVYVGKHNIDEELLDFPSGGLDIKIIPVVTGAGNVGKIIAGVALIGFAFMTGGAGFGVLGQSVFGKTAGAMMLGSLNVSALAGKLGMLLVLSGVAGLLTPTPELPDDESDPIKSFSFSGVQQTARSGTAIPVVYGKMLVGSIPISMKVETNERDT
jgi:predicted phage tail protein